MHGWSKFLTGEAAVTLLTGGAAKAMTLVDDAGRCANWARETRSRRLLRRRNSSYRGKLAILVNTEKFRLADILVG